jgi:hypothetical protein
MEVAMWDLALRDLALHSAGVLAILVAIAHGAIGELRVFARARIEPPRARTLLHLIFQATTVDWIGVAVLLIAAPWLGPQARPWIIAVAVVVYGYAAVGNAVASRGRHVGWVLMSCVLALTLIGI